MFVKNESKVPVFKKTRSNDIFVDISDDNIICRLENKIKIWIKSKNDNKNMSPHFQEGKMCINPKEAPNFSHK